MSKGPPTTKKLKKARKDGKVVKSQLLTKAICGTGVLFTLIFVLKGVLVKNQMLLQYLVVSGAKDPIASLTVAGKYFLIITGVCLIVGAFLSILVEWMQVGLILNMGALAPNFERLNPVKGAQKWATGIKQIWILIIKFVVVGSLSYWFLSREVSELSTSLLNGQPGLLVGSFQRTLLRAISFGGLALLALGGIEYFVNRLKFYKELEMSPEEMKREYREDEGDPHIKAARRARHQQLSMQAMVKRIRKAKVIVVEKA